ncbi:threonine dehydratase [Prauserella shujinwangii]|uniref:Threonine dehydratase n=1 Tax=Prauserella shujinwangii TaxID=1453103 RepID=A0A2T0LZM8_9PSEU|nr:pyridoxal-phosphate dependent enzyme [Prauserella shujinwangii]PRX49512.1 threonine dehydratase [Prauserella shujinwangii]
MTDLDLSADRIAEAAKVVDPLFRDTPQYVDGQLAAALGRTVVTKVETLNPLRSFKGRGMDFLARDIPPGTRLVCASAGNFGQAVAYAARKYGLHAHVFVARDISQVKSRRMAALGARVSTVDGDEKAAATEYAERHPDARLVVDGREPAIAEGAGTIGVELLETPGIDTVVVPVGDGALINGVACWLKTHAPSVRVVGVGAEGAPSFARSWREGTVVTEPGGGSFAAGINVRRPLPESVARARRLVDDMVLVDDAAILRAMRLAARTLGVLLEPAGAAGLAAIAEHDLPGGLMATVLTGANLDPARYPELL